MKIGQITPSRAAPFLALIAIWMLLGLFIHSFAGGSPSKPHWSQRWWNDEVVLHSAGILCRYRAFPISEHWFSLSAPGMECNDQEKPNTVSDLADQPNLPIVSSETLGGQSVYTSFPPGAFIIASAFVNPIAKFMTVSDLSALKIWNWCLALVTALIFAVTLRRVWPQDLKHQNTLTVLACLPFLIAVEPMHSHHQTLWAHQVMQPVIATALYLIVGRMTTRRAIALGTLCFVACWIEWTAYLLCIACFFVVVVKSEKDSQLKNATIFSITTLLGGLSVLAYYWQLVGIEPYFRSLTERFTSRSAAVSYYNWGDWLLSLMQSFGPWIAAIGLLLIELFTYRKNDSNTNIPATLIAVSAFILLENALMLEHAIVYTFDRLKWAFLIGLLIYSIGRKAISANERSIVWITVIPLLASAYSIYQYMDIYKPYWR